MFWGVDPGCHWARAPNGSSVQRGGRTRAEKGEAGGAPERGSGRGGALAPAACWLAGGHGRAAAAGPSGGQRGEGRGQERRRASAAAERDGKCGGGLGTQCVATGSRG